MSELHSTRGYIGGANIAGILGLSPFRTPLDEYLLIVNEMQDEMTPEKAEFFEDRRDLEPWAAKKFTRKTGLAIVRTNERYTDAVYPHFKAEIDFETADGCNGETKTVHPNAVRDWGDPENELPPVYVQAQAMWGMDVHPTSRCYVQALIGFDDHRVYVVERDDELIATIRQKAADFWRFHVLPRRPPPPTNAEDLLRLYPRDSGRAVEASADIRESLECLRAERQQLKLHTARKETHEYAIKDFMRDATILTVNGQSALTWKADTRGIRIFRLK